MNYLSLIDWEGDPYQVITRSRQLCEYLLARDPSQIPDLLEKLLEKQPFAAAVCYRLAKNILNGEERKAFYDGLYVQDSRLDRFHIDIERLAQLTAACLCVGYRDQLNYLIRVSIRLMRTLRSREEFQKAMERYLDLSYFDVGDYAFYLDLKYSNLPADVADDDLYYTRKAIPLGERVPGELRKVVMTAMLDDRFSYLYSLCRLFPTVTRQQLGIRRRDLLHKAEGLQAEFPRFLAFSEEMYVRSAPSPEEKAEASRSWCREMQAVLPRQGSFLEMYALCRCVFFCPQNAKSFFHKLEKTPIDPVVLYGFLVKDVQEKAFDALLKKAPQYLPAFIETLDIHNVYRFQANRDYASATPVSHAALRELLRRFRHGMSSEEAVDVYMNSHLRSVLPLTSFLSFLPGFPGEEGKDDIERYFRKYRCYGRLQEREGNYELLSFSFRNDFTRILPEAGIPEESLKRCLRERRTVGFDLTGFENREGELFLHARIVPEDRNASRFLRSRDVDRSHLLTKEEL
ncbi:MAG: hypothetical protein IKE21_06870 [Erysipelotrichaceae bacterium]|nr:hypothetical protein [Erysipelotrichaceae bacterium]